MISFQNSKTFTLDQLYEREKTVSTLLVPERLLAALKEKTKEHGNRMSVYFNSLLRRYRSVTHSGMIPGPRKIKTEYQDEGLDLRRVSFRVANSDWIEIGELGLAFGKSRCWLFVFLLEIDIAGLWDFLVELGLENAVPTKNSLRLKVCWSLQRVLHIFTRSYNVRV